MYVHPALWLPINNLKNVNVKVNFNVKNVIWAQFQMGQEQKQFVIVIKIFEGRSPRSMRSELSFLICFHVINDQEIL